MRQLARIVLIAAAGAVALASSSSRTDYSPPPQYGGQQNAQNAQSLPYWCHGEQSEQSGASVCYSSYQICEGERSRAADQGLTTTFCHQASPVACFQRGGQADPQYEWCANTLEDCEAWRRVDIERNQAQTDNCRWAH